MADTQPLYDPDDPEALACYRGAIRVLRGAGVPFLLGGAYSFARYTGIVRHTKDLDVFLREADVPRAGTSGREVGGHRLDAPARAVVEGAVDGRG